MGEAREARVIAIDHPTPTEPILPPEEQLYEISRRPESPPLPAQSPALTPVKDIRVARLHDEFESPAFIKRARISYGSLFEDGFDIFDDDGGIKGKGRKRTRFGRESGAWRYSSQSPSPEPPVVSLTESNHDEVDHTSPLPHPGVVDEGCQTMELDIPTSISPPASTSIFSKESPEPPPMAETIFYHQDGLVYQGVQAFPKYEPTPTVPVTTQLFTPAPVSQHASVDLPSFPTGHELELASDAFHPRWEPQTIDSTARIYIEDPVVHEQGVDGQLLSRPKDDLTDHQSASLEDIRSPYLSYSPAQHMSFAGHVEDNSHGISCDAEQDNPLYNAPQTIYPPLDAPDDVEGPPLSPNLLSDYPPSYLEDGVQPQQPMEAQLQPINSETPSSVTHIPIGVESIGWVTVNNSSGGASIPQARQLGSADGQSPESPVIIDEDDSDNEPTPAPGVVADILANGHADARKMYENAEAEEEVDSVYSEEDEAEYDADEAGGDYDTRNYGVPDDDEDDSHDEDLRSHRLEPQFDDAEEWDEEDELEDGEEAHRYQTDSENEYDTDDEEEEAGEAERPAPPVSQSTPMVIDLISSSEGEEEDEEDEGEEGEEGEDEEDEENREDEEDDDDEDEYEDEEDEDIQLPQPLAALSSLARSEDLPSRPRQSPGCDFESQEEMSISEHALVTSDAQEPADKEAEMAEEEQIQKEARANSADSERQPEALLVKDNAFHQITEVRREEMVTVFTQSTEVSERVEKDPDQRERDAVPFTAAEGLEILIRTVHPEKTEAKSEAGGQANTTLVESEQTAIRATDISGEISRSRDVEMIDSDVAEDDKLVTQDRIESNLKDVEMVEIKIVVSNEQPVIINGDAELLDHETPKPESLPNHPSLERSEVSQDIIPAPSSPPLTQSFSSLVTELKKDILIQDSTISLEARLPVDQLPSPLDTQPKDTTEFQETIAAEISLDKDHSYGDIQVTGLQESSTTQVAAISEEAVEQDPVQTMEAMIEHSEPHDSGKLQVQHQIPVEEEHVEESSQAAQFSKPIPNAPLETPLDFDNIIQVNLTREATQTAAELNGTVHTLDADSSEISSSFRSQMEGDEELQASILEDNSYELDELDQESKRSIKAEVQLPHQAGGNAQNRYSDKNIPGTETHEDIGRPSSPVLGFDQAKKPEEILLDVAENWRMQENSQSQAESNRGFSDEESQADPSVYLARAANVTRREDEQREVTSEVNHSRERSEDVRSFQSSEDEDSSVQLARASMNAPPKREEESNSLVEAKLQLARHLRDELPDCTQLQVLRHHIGQSLDVMGVAMMQPPDPQRARRGPREYMMSFTVTDQSTAPSAVVEVQLYRPHKDALPVVRRGDVVLLRRFRVVALPGKGFGLQTGEVSSWAVWDTDDVGAPPQIRGPPIEAIEREARHAAYLRAWFGLLDAAAAAKLERANQKIISAGRGKRKG